MLRLLRLNYLISRKPPTTPITTPTRQISTMAGQHEAAILPQQGGPNDVLIEVKAVALNPCDYFQRDYDRLLYLSTPLSSDPILLVLSPSWARMSPRSLVQEAESLPLPHHSTRTAPPTTTPSKSTLWHNLKQSSHFQTISPLRCGLPLGRLDHLDS